MIVYKRGGKIMKNCSHCSREVMSDAKFCQYCGADLPVSEVEEEIPATNNEGFDAPPLPEAKTPILFNHQTSPPPSNKGLVWLIISSITTFFGCCCLPLGFLQAVTIITSAISVSRYNRGDYEDSEKLARTSMIIYFSILALSIILLIVIFATGFYTQIADYTDIIDEFSEFY
jgi:hypothetical protein